MLSVLNADIDTACQAAIDSIKHKYPEVPEPMLAILIAGHITAQAVAGQNEESRELLFSMYQKGIAASMNDLMPITGVDWLRAAATLGSA